MKKLLFITIIAFASVTIMNAQAPKKNNNYALQWQEVVKYEKQSLPKSAKEQVDKILRQAVLDKNSPQIIKALIHQGKYDLALDAENDTLIFRNLNEMLAKSTDEVERSVLNSMLGELYMQYYQKDSWQISQRTELAGFVPADMKEWTQNIFYHKAVEHINASIVSQKKLLNSNVNTYAPVIILGKDSRRFYPTMYDFLALRAIEIFGQIETSEDLSRTLAKKNISQQSLFAPAEEFVKLNFNPQNNEYNLWVLETYRKFLSSLLERKMDKSVVLTELDKLNYLSRLRNAHSNYCLPLLNAMLKKWENQDFSVEIVDKMADFHPQKIAEISEQDTLKREALTKDLYDLLKKTVRQFPKYERISLIENKILQLTQPEFNAVGNNTFALSADKKLKINYKNINRLTAKLYKLSSPLSPVYNSYTIYRKKPIQKTFVKDIVFTLPSKAPYLKGETEVKIDVNQYGSYQLEFDFPGKEKTESDSQGNYYFSVSDLGSFARLSAKNKYDFFVVNRVTGKPVKNAKVNIYQQTFSADDYRFNLIETVITDEQGLAEYTIKNQYNAREVNRDLFYQIAYETDADNFLTPLPYSYYQYSEINPNPEARKSVAIFTDRSLYRPGQTVYFKAIAGNTFNDKSQVVSDKSLEFTLRDTNGRELSKQTLKTNEFGSVAGEFVLPQGILTGNFSILTDGARIYFRVEEYKRPTFEVTFNKIEKTYKFGEEITLKGKAENYSGVKLQNASVSYRITRQQSWWWRWGGPPEHFTEGVTTTDENGNFEIKFTPEKSDTQEPFIYTFNVEATVTDLNGETQTGNYSITVGDISMMLNIEMPDKLEKDSQEKIIITAKNLDGNDISAKGNYQIFSLHENDSINTQVVAGNFVTGEQNELKEQLKKLSSGKYRIKLQSQDDRGIKVEAEKDFILFSYADKNPPIKTNEWFVVKNDTFSNDKPAEILLGATDEVNVLYELWQKDTLLERKWITLNNENRLFTLPYKPEYKDGVTLMLTYVKDEKFFAFSPDLLVKKESKELNVKLDVFRDKIRPGANEEWRILVKDEAGKPALAEILAGMYDFSLDQIYAAPKWGLSLPSFGGYRFLNRFNIDHSFNQQMANAYIPTELKNVKSFEFDRFNWYDFSLFSYYYGGRMRGAAAGVAQLQSKTYSPDKLEVVEERLDTRVQNTLAEEEIFMITEDAVRQINKEVTPQIRRNFIETAFFFPQLRTNEKGETQIAFTVPESNTKWRFRVLAHDKNLNAGQAEAFTTSQKELMVTPNMPRFLRHGDQTSISAKISNLSEGSVNGNVRIEFFNPVTEEIVSGISMENQSQPFSLAQNASSDASWTFVVPDNIDMLGVRIVAQSASFSDGEQHALAVLPNRMLVTETLRMDVNGNETKSFTMDRLAKNASPTAQNYRLTLEFTSNPAWYAVQALPVLSNPDHDNAVSWFASYYANTLGMHIGKTYPKVSAMIEAWKKQGGTKETLISSLEKNQELRTVLLEETPWVLEAKNETEQKEKLALLFDLNRSQNLTRAALQKLSELQSPQGGWSWFKGFYPSVGITHYILYGFNQLKELQAVLFTDDVQKMQQKAIAYSDSEALRRFELLKRNKDWRNIKSISSTDLEYLYVRSAYTQYPLHGEAKIMTDFYNSVIEKNWTQFGLYERSLIAILMQRNGKQNVVQDILKSYREHATISDEMGMFWANNRAHVFMSQSAISVHTFIMDAFRLGGASATEMDNMKRWLLKQKQTQLWESTHATADAVYALLSTGNDWFSTEGKTTIKLGNETIKPESTDLGTGYFKESWSGSEIRPEMANVTVSHNENAPAWGGLYWQYFEDLDKISKAEASLDVEKLLFVEETDASGKRLIPITENRSLKIGDKVIVRLTVRTDRDLEFVHLKDMRAAAFEPVEQLSGTKWKGGTIYYQTSKDASTNFYFDTLPRGTYVFEYGVYVTRTGSYSNGITTIQCLYAPEFTSHTAGIRVEVNK